MEKRKELMVLGRILERIAPRIGARVLREPIWGVAGQITFKSGRRSYFRYNTLDLNPMGGSAIAKDKDYANFFMQSMGYPIVPRGKTFFSPQWAKAIQLPQRNIDAAYHYAKKIGLPVIVKPNSGSQGAGVALVHNKREFYRALRSIFTRDRVALVQKLVSGKDYRLVVLDDKIISAYERRPLHVIGDGRTSIERLLKRKRREFLASSRDTNMKIDDPRIAEKLAHQKMTLSSVPREGQRVYLLDNANLSTGGDSIDVTRSVHPEFRKIAVQLTRDMGLRLCGVDVIIDGTIEQKPKTYWVLEVNSAPGLDHYSKMGKVQEKIVEDLYLEVLKHLER